MDPKGNDHDDLYEEIDIAIRVDSGHELDQELIYRAMPRAWGCVCLDLCAILVCLAILSVGIYFVVKK